MGTNRKLIADEQDLIDSVIAIIYSPRPRGVTVNQVWERMRRDNSSLKRDRVNDMLVNAWKAGRLRRTYYALERCYYYYPASDDEEKEDVSL